MSNTTPRRNITVNNTMWLLKPLAFLLMLVPCLLLIVGLFSGQLDPNPIEAITRTTGEWALRFLMLGLALTPIKLYFKLTWPLRFRRMVGLFAFFYVVLHVSTYIALDQGFNVLDILLDVVKRPYISAGFVAFVILIPLAITSTRAMVKRLGRKWQALHRWVYPAATASVLHFIWLAKGEKSEPNVYMAILLVLLTVRLLHAIKKPV